jgi:DNA-binding MarR family transcriptional regulator
MEDKRELGELLEMFVNTVSHPRGRVLEFMSEASVTVPQSILLNFASMIPNCTPSSLAAKLHISLPSASQMIERLVKLELLERMEDASDRRRKVVTATAKGRTFLKRQRALRIVEYAAGTALLTETTRLRLTQALKQALSEMVTPTGGTAN